MKYWSGPEHPCKPARRPRVAMASMDRRTITTCRWMSLATTAGQPPKELIEHILSLLCL